MIGAPNSLNLNCKVRVMKEAPVPSVSEEIADIFTNYNIDNDNNNDDNDDDDDNGSTNAPYWNTPMWKKNKKNMEWLASSMLTIS